MQVFDKKSDRAEFTGVDDGQSEKSINLKLKKDRNNALFGRATAGAGTHERYDGQTNINKFKGDQQFSVIGMGNNTNRQGFSITDILNFTGELSGGMRSAGGITIRTGGLIRHTAWFELQVRDNGIGIPDAYKTKIFEQFFRVPSGNNRHNTKGYGLGLSYVKHIIQQHHGIIEVESELGKGITFIVKIPFAETSGIHTLR